MFPCSIIGTGLKSQMKTSHYCGRIASTYLSIEVVLRSTSIDGLYTTENSVATDPSQVTGIRLFFPKFIVGLLKLSKAT